MAESLQARMEKLLLSGCTLGAPRGVFDVTVHPPLVVEGKSGPIRICLVRRARPRPFRTMTSSECRMDHSIPEANGRSIKTTPRRKR